MNREILRLAIPNIISNISIPLLSTVDTALMGRLSELHIGAVGIAAMIFNLVYWNFGFLRMGTTGMTAQAYGQKNETAIQHTLLRALLLAVCLAFLIILLQDVIAYWTFQFMNVSEAQFDLVNDYFRIRIWAAPATIALFALMGWFFGMQNAIYPLAITILINCLNIAFSYFFVRHYQMGTAGVAYGTLIAQYSGLAFACLLLVRKYKHLFKTINTSALLQFQAFRRFLSINRDIFIRTLCLTLVFGFFYSKSAAAGATILAVNVILLQFINWMSYGIDGFAYASESLVGKYQGAKDLVNLKKSIRYSFLWGFILSFVYAFSYLLAGEFLLGIFTDKNAVIAAAKPFLYWMALYPIISAACYIWDGIYIGLTASKAMRETMLLSLIVFLSVYYLLPNSLGNDLLWAALLAFMAARGILQTLWFKKENMLRMEQLSSTE